MDVIHGGSGLASSLSVEIYIHPARLLLRQILLFILVNTKHFINSQIHTEFGSLNKPTRLSIMSDISVIDALENVHCEPIILFYAKIVAWVVLALELGSCGRIVTIS